MSCGGDGHGRTTGFGGIVSTMATEHGVTVAAARKFAHQVISERRVDGTNYPDPTREQIVGHLRDFAKRTAYRRDHPKAVEPGKKPVPAERWNGYIDSVVHEAKNFWSDPNRKLPSGAEFSVWQDMPGLLKGFAAQNRCPDCGEFISPYGGKAHTCSSKNAETKAPATVAPAPKDSSPAGLPALQFPMSVAAPADTGEYDPDSLQIGQTPLSGVKVGDMREWIRESQRKAFAMGVAAAAAAQESPTPAPAYAGAGGAYAMPQPKAVASFMEPTYEMLHGSGKPANMTASEKLADLVTGLHRCETCGQFVGEDGHYCTPAGEAGPRVFVPADGQEPPHGSGDADAEVDGPGMPYEPELEESNVPGPPSTAASAARFTQRILLNPKGWKMMAPYAFRAAIIIAPLVLTAGMTLAPLALAWAVFMALRTPKWLNKRGPEKNRELIDHYNKPYPWQRSRQTDDYDDYEPLPDQRRAPAPDASPAVDEEVDLDAPGDYEPYEGSNDETILMYDDPTTAFQQYEDPRT